MDFLQERQQLVPLGGEVPVHDDPRLGAEHLVLSLTAERGLQGAWLVPEAAQSEGDGDRAPDVEVHREIKPEVRPPRH